MGRPKKMPSVFEPPRIKETISCPKCSLIQEADITNFFPWDEYQHTCLECGYLILDGEWNKVKQETK